MKITIITVVYNNEKYIEDCIQSVINQTYKDIEFIIVDGASTDGTVQVIQKYSDFVTKFISEPDKGIYHAMNKGIAMATGDIIGILNSDDVYCNNSVLNEVASVFADPHIGACYADLRYVDQLNLNKTVRNWKSCDYREDLLKKGWVPPHPTFFVRRVFYENCGNFDLSYCLAADYELMVRFLYIYKIKSIYVPQVFTKMRVGGASNKSLHNIIKQNIEIYRALRKNRISIRMLFFYVNKIIDRISQFAFR